MKRRFSVLVAMVASVAGAACSGSGVTTPPIIIVAGGVASFAVRTSAGFDTASVLIGQTTQLKGTAYDGSQSVVTGTWVIGWTSRDSTIASVDATGLVHTRASGQTWVIGTIHPDSSNTFSDSVLVIVQTPQ